MKQLAVVFWSASNITFHEIIGEINPLDLKPESGMTAFEFFKKSYVSAQMTTKMFPGFGVPTDIQSMKRLAIFAGVPISVYAFFPEGNDIPQFQYRVG